MYQMVQPIRVCSCKRCQSWLDERSCWVFWIRFTFVGGNTIEWIHRGSHRRCLPSVLQFMLISLLIKFFVPSKSFDSVFFSAKKEEMRFFKVIISCLSNEEEKFENRFSLYNQKLIQINFLITLALPLINASFSKWNKNKLIL